MPRAYLGIGSNLGDRQAALDAARTALAALPGVRQVRMSPVYETAPVGGPADQGPFLNAALELDTDLPPRQLLEAMQAIERQQGRPPRSDRTRWGPRVLDLDLLLYDDQVIDEPGLHVPHPRLHERMFVLRPLADLNPEARHPLMKLTVRELLEQLDGRAG